ncbi:hypothetical protein CC86DRAFT_3093 [Ophiobolus disseminans]|uniref:Uncharacterized protein n=1 Tax=Ophiobolus disseminans TaxID=1469910 RepID=A0A6A7AI52_9PLEO|nr:hypothetical protein CC86DRAFT_3093 [Ophiobolus disseminans]
MLPSKQITQRLLPTSLTRSASTIPTSYTSHGSRTFASNSDASSSTSSKDETLKSAAKPLEEPKPKKKTQSELDQELQLKLQGLAGDGGDAGIEYEDGKPVSMKRSVKNNMFRYI